MQKFKLSLCLAISMVLFAWAGKAMAQTSTQVWVNGFYYKLSGSEAIVTGTTKSFQNTPLVFPETINYGGQTYQVTTIAPSAIRLQGSLAKTVRPSQIIGNSIEKFYGGGSFVDDADLVSISFPKLKVIATTGFTFGGSKLTSLNLPSLEEILLAENFCKNATSLVTLSLPKLKKISNSRFCFTNLTNATSISMPELELLYGNELFEGTFNTGVTFSLPKLSEIGGLSVFYNLSGLTSLSLPSLTKIDDHSYSILKNLPTLKKLSIPSMKDLGKGQQIISDMPSLTLLDLPSLESIYASYSIYNMDALTSLNLPKLEKTQADVVIMGMKNLTSLSVPKLKSIESPKIFSKMKVETFNLPEGTSIGLSEGAFSSSYASSLTVTGLTSLTQSQQSMSGSNIKFIKLPDLETFETSSIGDGSPNLELISIPKVKYISTSRLGNQCQSLTAVNLPELKAVSDVTLFMDSPVKRLTLCGDFDISNYMGLSFTRMYLNAYPTVVTVTDANTVNELPVEAFGNNIKGGRFIVPEGKAALYAAKWHLPLDKTMVYSPVTLSKQTDGTKYASGSIPKTASESVYEGTTYTNTYDLMHGMTKADCEDPEALGINDIGFTPSLSTLNVHTAAPDPLANVTAYAAKSYVDKHRTSSTEAKEGVLTLEDLSLSAGTTTVKGFGTSAATYGKPVGRATGGFLFKGNTSAFTEVYLPYINAAATTATTNYLKPGEGTTVADDASGDRNFYWHPGGSGFDTGFYHSENTLVPDGRAYLCLPNGISSYAFAKINIQFVDSQTTGISTINNPVEAASQPWYTLSGIRLVGKPTQGGIYIHGGQKVIIR